MSSIKQFPHFELLFPGKYAKASDLRDASATVVIEAINPEEELVMTGGKKDVKPCLRLRGKQKAFVLNKTNARAIAAVYGTNPNDWIGKAIVIAPRMVEAHGKMVEAIRVDEKATRQAAGSHAVAAPVPEEPASVWDAFNDIAPPDEPPMPAEPPEDIAVPMPAPAPVAAKPATVVLAMPDDSCARVPPDMVHLSRKLSAVPFADQDLDALAKTAAELDALARKSGSPANKAALAVVATFARAAIAQRAVQ